MQKINPFLWFDGKAEEAANFYTSVFGNSRIAGISRYGEAGPGPKGAVMSVTFELDGQKFMAFCYATVYETDARSVGKSGIRPDIGFET